MNNRSAAGQFCIVVLIVTAIIASFCCVSLTQASSQPSGNNATSSDNSLQNDGSYKVVEVVDGDTIKVQYGDTVEKVRLVGIDTPETVDPDTPEECYGKEASDYLKEKLTDKTVKLVRDLTQDDRDKYSRLLRYAFLDGNDVGHQMILQGYANEYTYQKPYVFQSSYIYAEQTAKDEKRGMWADGVCSEKEEVKTEDEQTPVSKEELKESSPNIIQNDTSNCVIKGNISLKTGEKIYHVPGQKYYDSTKIDESKGERWFCTEAEAQAAGWRKSKQ